MSKKVNFGTNPRIKTGNVEDLADDWVNNGAVSASEQSETTRFTIDIPIELHRRIKSYCALKGVKMKEEIQELLKNHFSE
jgi:polyhydroxyalkanoate synthesis regulator phasin